MLAAGASARAGTDWPNYGNDRGAMRYSPLDQITPANVTSLKVAWTYHMKPADATRIATSETTPLVVGNIMYLGSPYGHIVALDATTGKEIWNYKLPGNRRAPRRAASPIGPATRISRRRFCSAPMTASWWRSM